ncbi:hypothetical protein SISSUDRAFT_1064111 [Sistotremastrum suecicum HHB10207 ss-3]|uniref:VWFA domain-containing protein n=1 Tax=Sistotremastrum suecicum HHB10207 ss-3 TaxID=1314776 RepID=A0A166B141_9AGAM|nr:hypothetical protein SISSUDRAFT_1064111 [Sistotremastrum suecicum HHB10207 ss-3]
MAQPSKSRTNVILLVETSQATLSRWPDVRQHYLPLLLEALEARSPRDQLSVAVLTVYDELHGLPNPLEFPHFADKNSQLENLRQLEFTTNPSPTALWNSLERSLQLLLRTGAEVEATRSSHDRHHVVVYLCPPSQAPRKRSAADRKNSINSSLAKRVEAALVQHNVQLSFIIGGSKAGELEASFNNIVSEQNNQSIPAWFNYNPKKYYFLLSGFSRAVKSAPPRSRSRSPSRDRRSSSPRDSRRTLRSPFERTSSAASKTSSSGRSEAASRRPGVVGDLRERFGFKRASVEPPSFLCDPTTPLSDSQETPRGRPHLSSAGKQVLPSDVTLDERRRGIGQHSSRSHHSAYSARLFPRTVPSAVPVMHASSGSPSVLSPFALTPGTSTSMHLPSHPTVAGSSQQMPPYSNVQRHIGTTGLGQNNGGASFTIPPLIREDMTPRLHDQGLIQPPQPIPYHPGLQGHVPVSELALSSSPSSPTSSVVGSVSMMTFSHQNPSIYSTDPSRPRRVLSRSPVGERPVRQVALTTSSSLFGWDGQPM